MIEDEDDESHTWALLAKDDQIDELRERCLFREHEIDTLNADLTAMISQCDRMSALLDQASDCLAKNLNVPESKAVVEAWRKLKGEI